MIKIKKSLKARIMSGLLLMAVAIPMTLNPIKAEAHNAFYIQTLINPNNFTYSASVAEDSASIFKDESKHYEAKLGDFTKIKDLGGASGLEGLMESIKSGSQEIKPGKGSEIMPLTFPAIQVQSKDKNKNVNNATAKDSNRAAVIKDILIPSLNDALLFVNGGKPFKSVDELVEMTDKLYNADSHGNKCGDYTVEFWKSSGKGNTSYESLGIEEKDHVLITSPKGEIKDFVYKIPKGYKKIDGRDEKAYPLRGDQGDEYDEAYDKDAEYITWSMLAYEAIYSYYGQDVSMNNSTQQTNPGSLAKKMIDFLGSSVNSIKDALSLYSIDELVFNQGTRGNQAAFYNGVMPISWEKNVVFYHWIFQAMAWALMIFAIVKLVAQKNLSTINSAMRVYMINGIKNLLIAGFALTLIFPILELITKTNFNIVNIFSAASPKTFNQFTSEVVTGGDTLGAVILQLINLVIMIYMNYLYIVRAITIALLITSAPMFIVAGSLGNTGYGVTMSWIKELLANIFIQTFHAFILSFFTSVSFNTRSIETIIVFVSLIPLTAMFKSLVFKDGGSTTERLGAMATKASGALGIGAAKGIFGRNNNKHNDNHKSKDDNNSESNSSSESSGDSNSTNTSKKKGSTTQTSSSGSDNSNNTGTTNGTTNGTSNGTGEGSMSVDDAGTMQNSIEQSKKSTPTKDFIKKSAQNVGDAMNSKTGQAIIKGTKIGTKAALKVGATAGKIGLGATGVGLGIGYMAATGDTSMIQGGASFMGKATKDAVIGTGKATVGAGKAIGGAIDKFGQKKQSTQGENNENQSGSSEESSNIPNTNIPPTNGEDTMPQEMLDGGESVTNGDTTYVTRGIDYLNEQGIDDIRVTSGGKSGETYSTTTYSTQVTKDKEGNYVLDESSVKGKMKGKNSQNVVDCVNAFKDPYSVEAQHYREQGIQNARVNKAGKVEVTYNKIGQDKLGYDSIKTSGQGENKRVEERKKKGRSMNTNLTVDVPKIDDQTRQRLQQEIDNNKN